MVEASIAIVRRQARTDFGLLLRQAERGAVDKEIRVETRKLQHQEKTNPSIDNEFSPHARL